MKKIIIPTKLEVDNENDLISLENKLLVLLHGIPENERILSVFLSDIHETIKRKITQLKL